MDIETIKRNREWKQTQYGTIIYLPTVEEVEWLIIEYDRMATENANLLGKAARLQLDNYECQDNEARALGNLAALTTANAGLQQRLDAAEEALRVAQGQVVEYAVELAMARQQKDEINAMFAKENKAKLAANSRVEELTAEVERHNEWAKTIAKELGCADAAQYRNDALDGIRALPNRCKPAIADHCSMSVLNRRVERLREALDYVAGLLYIDDFGDYALLDTFDAAVVEKALADDAKEVKGEN